MRWIVLPRWFWQLLTRLRCPDWLYYRLLDVFTDNNGWRPLRMRYPEHFSPRSPIKATKP